MISDCCCLTLYWIKLLHVTCVLVIIMKMVGNQASERFRTRVSVRNLDQVDRIFVEERLKNSMDWRFCSIKYDFLWKQTISRCMHFLPTALICANDVCDSHSIIFIENNMFTGASDNMRLFILTMTMPINSAINKCVLIYWYKYQKS